MPLANSEFEVSRCKHLAKIRKKLFFSPAPYIDSGNKIRKMETFKRCNLM